MARGRPRKWVTAKMLEPIPLGKAGIEIVVWDKWKRTRRGTAVITVGGIGWKAFKAKGVHRKISWDELDAG